MATADTTTLRQHPDIFTDDEAWVYLKLPSKRAFETRRREHGIRGVRSGPVTLYSREQLDAMRLIMFGLDQPVRRKAM